MYCIACGTELPDNAAFCFSCGQQQPFEAGDLREQKRQARPRSVAAGAARRTRAFADTWEYKEVNVPLNIVVKTASGDFGQEVAVRNAAIQAGSLANSTILGVLQDEGMAGWHPDESTDLFSLLVAGRVSWRQTGGLFLSWKFTFSSAAIRLRRLVQEGVADTRQTRVDPIDDEVTEIEIYLIQLNFPLFGAPRWVFRAQAIGLEDKHTLAESEPFTMRSAVRLSRTAPKPGTKSKIAFDNLTERLDLSHWESTSAGPAWYSKRFRRLLS